MAKLHNDMYMMYKLPEKLTYVTDAKLEFYVIHKSINAREDSLGFLVHRNNNTLGSFSGRKFYIIFNFMDSDESLYCFNVANIRS